MNRSQFVKAILVAIVSILGPGLVPCSAESIKLGKFQGKTYFYDTGSYSSIGQARNAAFKAGRVLASIGSADENNFLISKITPLANRSLRAAWVGLTQTSANQFSGENNESTTYANWRPAGTGFDFAEPTTSDSAPETAIVLYINDATAPLGLISLGLWADTYPSGSEGFNAIQESEQPKRQATIKSKNKEFLPYIVTIKSGGTLKVRNDDTFFIGPYVNGVTSPKRVKSGGTLELKLFAKNGKRTTYNLFDSIHPRVEAKVIVVP